MARRSLTPFVAAAAVVAPLVVSLPRALAAQAVAVAGGISVPRGTIDGRTDVGGHAQLSLEFGRPARTLAFRLDALYVQLPGALVTLPEWGTVGRWSTERTYALTGAAVLRGPALGGGGVRPYALLGAGMYGQNSYTGYNVGVNAGAGVAVPVRDRVQLFAEARAHAFRVDARPHGYGDRAVTLVPLSLGVRF